MVTNVRFRCLYYGLYSCYSLSYRIFIRFSPRGNSYITQQTSAFIGNCYVEIFRNIPLIVQAILWAFVFPEFLPDSISAGSGDVVAGGWWKNLLNQQPAVIGVFALGLYTAARVSEHIRAGSILFQQDKNLLLRRKVLPLHKAIVMSFYLLHIVLCGPRLLLKQ